MKRPARRKPSPKQTHWGDVARWYDGLVGDEGSEFHRHVVLPGVLRMLDVKPGQRIIDVACGQGVLCRMLRKRGAGVVGVDAARALIELARERSPSQRDLRYLVGDARNLTTLKVDAHSFDAAACVLAIQNIDPIRGVFRGVAHLLRPGGRFVMAMMHPCFRVPKAADWGWDASTSTQYRRVDRYLKAKREAIATHPGSDPSQHTWTFHRPLHQYVEALAAAGLLIDALEEWPSHKISDSGPRAKAENVARREIPMFLALRAVAAPLECLPSGKP